MKLFAKAGDQVTCENGHIICTVSRNIFVADDYVPTHLINWTQPEPKTGSLTDVKCAQCGALFWHGYKGQHFHFTDGWRRKKPTKAWRKHLMEAENGGR